MSDETEKEVFITIRVAPERKKQAEELAKKEGLGLAPWARKTIYRELDAA